MNCGINGEIGNSIFFGCKVRVDGNALDKCMPIYMGNNIRREKYKRFTNSHEEVKCTATGNL